MSHEDFAQSIEAHPYLPLYLTGDARGLLSLWEFCQSEDRSLDTWFTEQGDWRQLDAKKSTVKKIAFNGYGDKVYSCNLDGHISVFNFDNMESSRSMPIFQLKKSKEEKISDFEILNHDTVFAAVCAKPKHLWVYDTLFSSRGGLILEAPVGGSVIQSFKGRSQIVLFNGEKAGSLTLYDLKMNKVIL